MSPITSRSNPKVKQIRALQQRKRREKMGLFVVEGIRHVGEAVEAGAALSYLCYAPDLLDSDFAYQLVEAQQAQNIPTYVFSADVMRSLADKDNPQGILAVVEQPAISLKTLHPPDFSWGVALLAPQDPGNLGTILRTIDAVGADGLILLDNSVDPYHPTAVRASMGTLFWHPVVQASFVEFADWATQHDYHIYGTSVRGSVDYRDVRDYASPTILLMGSEREGLAEGHMTCCDQLVRLPMHGHVTSLNLAVATGVLLYDMLLKRS